MPAKFQPMTCPQCGVALNHHAEKLVEPTSTQEAAQMDPALGGLIEEMHSCPECGQAHSRRSS